MPNLLHSRQDAAGDPAAQTQAVVEATLTAYRGAVSFSINYIVVYLVQTFLVVFVLAFMARYTTSAIRRNPIFSILIICGILSIAECAVNVSQLRDTLVVANTAISRTRYTASIALLFFIPFLSDVTLIFRIAAFYPAQGGRMKNRMRMLAAIAFPCAIKIPRIVFISLYTSFVWNATKGNPSMAEVVLAITDTQLSTVEWSLMLADQLYCTFFLVAKLYSLGWGWGDSKRISGSLLESIKLVLVSALASFFIPTCFLITLIIFQVNQLNQVVQGFVFVTCSHIVIIGCCFACLWPAIRAAREKNASSRGMVSSHEKTSPSRSRGNQMQSQMQSRGRNSLQLRRLDSLPQDLGYEDQGAPFSSYVQKNASIVSGQDLERLSSKGDTTLEAEEKGDSMREEMNPFSQDEKRRYADLEYSPPASPSKAGVRSRQVRSNSNTLSIEEECRKNRPMMGEKKGSSGTLYFESPSTSPSTLVGSPQSPSKFKSGSDLESSPTFGRGRDHGNGNENGNGNDGFVMNSHPLQPKFASKARPFTPPNKSEQANEISPTAGDHPYSYSRSNSIGSKRESREGLEGKAKPNQVHAQEYQDVELNDGGFGGATPSTSSQQVPRRPVPTQSRSNNNLRSEQPPTNSAAGIAGITVTSETQTTTAPSVEQRKFWNGRKNP